MKLKKLVVLSLLSAGLLSHADNSSRTPEANLPQKDSATALAIKNRTDQVVTLRGFYDPGIAVHVLSLLWQIPKPFKDFSVKPNAIAYLPYETEELGKLAKVSVVTDAPSVKKEEKKKVFHPIIPHNTVRTHSFFELHLKEGTWQATHSPIKEKKLKQNKY